jgi:hypothetical protein
LASSAEFLLGNTLDGWKKLRDWVRGPLTKNTKQEANISAQSIVSGKYGSHLTVTDGKIFLIANSFGKQ